MCNKFRIMFFVSAFVLIGTAGVLTGHAQGVNAKTVSPELIGQLTKELSITPKQAAGGAGTLFSLAKTSLPADQFSQIASVVPGMDGLLKSAPKVKSSSSSGMGAVTGMLPGSLGGLASAAGSFKALGLSPDMITKMAPMLEQFVTAKGGSGVGSLLGGIFK